MLKSRIAEWSYYFGCLSVGHFAIYNLQGGGPVLRPGAFLNLILPAHGHLLGTNHAAESSGL